MMSNIRSAFCGVSRQSERDPTGKIETKKFITTRFIGVLLLMASSMCCSSRADELNPPTTRGQTLATKMCAGCHAVGRAGQSPHIGAPTFRTLDRQVDLDTFMDRLRNGLASGHPDMPTFRFAREDARALVAYLRSIQTD